MARAKASWLASRRLLAVAGTALFVHALIPARTADPWTRLLRAPLEIVVQPPQRQLSRVLSGIRGSPLPPTSSDPRVAQLQSELDLYKMYYQQKLDDLSRLQRQIEDMQKGRGISPDLPVVQIPAPVVGGGTDRTSSVLKVRAGRRKGITPYNAVAVVQGVYVVGKVTAAAAPFFDVVPITDRHAGKIHGVVMLDDAHRGPTCMLASVGDGTLRGPVEYPEGAVAPPPPTVGMTVRLQDDTWPAHAQMLVVGAVERVETLPNQRPLIVVRPKARIDRVSEVMLRVLGEVEDEPIPASAPLNSPLDPGAGAGGKR